ncbi:TonB-dependent receptor [Spirosoma rhododendri]|uniref:TonB-dependent receptor n=1 Tax=Spirosoma rhododendri TaxID=2728024 RepID=A0A7L5DPQ9_9BACT|nr:TonB-dependent receptor [Spirosoma rhododendri]QJD79183.1 TonB-dependent receptor [Spirosoma rhododendri]
MKATFTTICYTFFLLLVTTVMTLAQTGGSISGVVKTSDGSPASFVNVGLKEARKGTVTAEDGSFTLKNIAPGSYTLRITFVGLQPQDQSVTVSAGRTTTANFSLVESASQLDEVEVTGSNKVVSVGKAGLAPLDLPQMTGIVSNVVIENQQISRLGDAIRNVSGVALTQQRGGVAETFTARGYSIGIAGGAGSIFKNGVISNTNGFPEASTLESVEVLKGASSLLYGNVSGGMIINLVTKKPRFDFGGEVQMRVGSFGLYKPIVDIYGPIAKNLAFRVVGTYERSNSYRDVVKTDRVYVNPSLQYNLGSKTTILLQGDYLKSNLTPDFGVGSLNLNQDAVIPDVPRSRFINVAWAYNNLDQKSGSVTVNHSFNDNWKLTAIGAAQQTNVTAFGTGVPNNNIAANGDWNRTLSRTLTTENNATGQVNLTGRFNTGKIAHQVLVGADLVAVTNISNSFTITNNGTTVTTYDKFNILNPSLYPEQTYIPNADVVARTTAPSLRNGVYIQDLIALSDKFKVLAGVRWSSQKTLQTTILNQMTGVETRGPAVDKTDAAFSPKFALIYQPTRTTSTYVSYANNFNINTGVDIYGATLSPSIVDQYELGIKNDLFGGRVSANASVYRIQNSNLALTALTKADGSPNTDTNVKEFTGQTTSDGFEVDINASLSKNFYFITGYAYNYIRYTKTAQTTGAFIEGERLTNSPAHTANATIFYTFDLPKLRGLKLGASAFYTGARNGGNNNTYGQTPAFSRLIPLTGFTTIDLTAGYGYRAVSLLVKLSNITNELNYLIHDRYSIMPIPPRQLTATLGYKF